MCLMSKVRCKTIIELGGLTGSNLSIYTEDSTLALILVGFTEYDDDDYFSKIEDPKLLKAESLCFIIIVFRPALRSCYTFRY
ncbi:hypothetical protein HanIR_Chr03g0113901 [Helianthus annuus]|nr:hypothetical protein HanIR_Chr03g0113901 [Helianthus annuus]